MDINIIELTKENFEQIMQTQNKIIVMVFWASWCGPCKIVEPIIEEIAKEYKDKTIITKVNVDKEKEIAIKFGIKNIPTVLFINNNKIVNTFVGAKSKLMFYQEIDKILKNSKQGFC